MSNSRTFEGRVAEILPIKTGTSNAGKPWRSQKVLVSEEQGEWPESCYFGAFGDKCDIISGLRIGQSVTVHYKLGTYNGFNNVNLWKVEISQAQQAEPTVNQYPTQQAASVHDTSTVAEDDLPF